MVGKSAGSGAAGGNAKQLFEVYVNKYDESGAKTTIGMLYINLTLHIPKTSSKSGTKQAACLQLSNCVHPSVRLSLTVQSSPASAPAQPPGEAQQQLHQQVKELTDEVRRLKRENDRLKEEEAYTYSNQPARPSVKAYEAQIQRLEEELAVATRRSEERAQTYQQTLEDLRKQSDDERASLREAFGSTEARLGKELSEWKMKFDRLQRDKDSAVASACDEMNKSFQATVENNRVKGEACSMELDTLQADLSLARKENDTLRKQVKQYQDNQDGMKQTHDETVSEARELRMMCDALESQKTHLSQRLDQLHAEHKELVARSQDENAATEEAKRMLAELMSRIHDAQRTEEALQSALAVSDEEKSAAAVEQQRLSEQVGLLQQALRTARQEEKAITHAKVDDLSRELDAQKVATSRLQHEAQISLSRVTAERDEAAKTVAAQTAQLVKKKRRIADLKQIVCLHLTLKQAQSMASADGVSPSDMLLASMQGGRQQCLDAP
eukprot:TRINITY_DN39495_c0_g1_i1.p1 TRINITY_DN39495_c0_g1~~TRINITY_DN39495_c0_g1_i1.p1  ORF type:complete len:528 (+),score=249.32 TRINITY_DN39495_c0_g1_i1:95-1585(+)